jgi:hypothetical protein
MNIEFAKIENDDISFIFPINPNKADITTGQKQNKIKIPGRNGNLTQFMGREDKQILISGTLYSGTQYYNKGKKISLEDLVGTLQKISTMPAVFDFAGILTNQAKAEKVTVSGFKATLNSKSPYSFNYNMTLTEYRAFNVPMVNLVSTSTTEFVNKLKETFTKNRLRRT